ncbi:hypothetical protein MIND_00962400 [Mycena indigotica]|uniref:Phytase A n=1 Tax=Mycena indigotica TaxID=2126181 RepID=A0A8H6SE50_9AGAR|nr:uncharacterized protein MIND_00962400 [Mycena indigotica]KAF7297292.1 hypothetical protein MIND_00962400 [Mycena indigotica]
MFRALTELWAVLPTFIPFLRPQIPLLSPAHDLSRFAIEHSWGVYSPFHATEDYPPIPEGCDIDQVNILHRHGARLPSESQTEDILSGVTKLLGVDEYTDERLDFLHTFHYPLGENLLVPLGALQSQQSGATAFHRYKHLLSEDDLPFIRASGMSRVVDSALNWTAGFAAASEQKHTPRLSVIISEAGNDTLQDNNCPNAASSHKEMREWLEVYAPPITSRLNSWAPGASLTHEDIHGLMMLCAFHTVASVVPEDFESGKALPYSPFCDLFESREFESFAYSSDVDRYYSTGYGGRLGKVQGVGYVNELLARLTRSPVSDQTCTNTTLDSHYATFPLDRTIYADFTHDAPLIAVFNAIGLFPTPSFPTRPRGGPDSMRDWRTSRIMTFSSRMVVEKLECQPQASSADPTEDLKKHKKKRTKKFIRVLVNEVQQPLEFCGAPTSGPLHGLCEFDAFLESQMYSRNHGEGDWDKCFE